MGMTNETIYIKIEQNNLVENAGVTIRDIGKLTGNNQEIIRHINQIVIYRFQNPKQHPLTNKKQIKVMTILKVIDAIQKEYPKIEVVNLGESDFIMEYGGKNPTIWWETVKVIFICSVILCGSAFTIMAFHNDIGIQEVFQKFYYQITGKQSDGFTILEISYCIGIFSGIVLFFNHIGRKKITPDPTPIQVQMRKYEKDVDDCYIQESGRGGTQEDVE
ncbi:MAG: stage V sporulation protein AA [Lachnospiraceae bacterium]